MLIDTLTAMSFCSPDAEALFRMFETWIKQADARSFVRTGKRELVSDGLRTHLRRSEDFILLFDENVSSYLFREWTGNDPSHESHTKEVLSIFILYVAMGCCAGWSDFGIRPDVVEKARRTLRNIACDSGFLSLFGYGEDTGLSGAIGPEALARMLDAVFPFAVVRQYEEEFLGKGDKIFGDNFTIFNYQDKRSLYAKMQILSPQVRTQIDF